MHQRPAGDDNAVHEPAPRAGWKRPGYARGVSRACSSCTAASTLYFATSSTTPRCRRTTVSSLFSDSLAAIARTRQPLLQWPGAFSIPYDHMKSVPLQCRILGLNSHTYSCIQIDTILASYPYTSSTYLTANGQHVCRLSRLFNIYFYSAL